MANWELQLVSAVVRDEDASEAFSKAKETGIETSMFGNAEARTLWSGIEYHYNRPDRFGNVPSEQFLRETYGGSDLPDFQEDLESLCDLVKTRYLKRRAQRYITEFLDTTSVDVVSNLADLYSQLGILQETCCLSDDKSFSDLAVVETIEDIQSLEDNDGIVGMPYPWDRLNAATGGIHPGDFLLVYALPKSMKTWVGLYISTCLAMTGRKVLIYSKEMMWENMRRRIACIVGEINYGKYKRSQLNDYEKTQLYTKLEEFQSCRGDIQFTSADRTDGSAGGPNEIRRKMEIYKPDFVMLDSAYMLELPGNKNNPYDWKSLATVNRYLKQIAKTTRIPILAILQENERAALKYKGSRGTASLAMNTSAIQDCDLAIRVVYHRKLNELSLHLPAARETTDNGFTVNAIPGENFSYAHDKLWDVSDCDSVDAHAAAPDNSDVMSRIQEQFGSILPQEG